MLQYVEEVKGSRKGDSATINSILRVTATNCPQARFGARIMVQYAQRSFVVPASASALCATADKESAEEMEVIFCCFSSRDAAVYERLIENYKRI